MKKNNIEEKTLKLYNKNLKYLKEFHNDIFEKITIFSDLINQKTYKKTLFLEYKSGYFNVYDDKNKSYIYKTNHKDYLKEFKKNLNFKHDNGFNTLNEYAYYMDFDTKVSDEIIHIRDALAPFTSYINEKFPTSKKNKEFKYIQKYIAIGTLLGFHLKDIKKFYNPTSFLIIEPHIELFRLSLFTTDYKKLSKNCNLYFSIMDDHISFHTPFSKFYEVDFVNNYFFKFHVTNSSYEFILQYIAGDLQYTSPFNFDHLRIIDSLKKTTSLIKDNYRFLNLKNYKNNLFQNKPVLLLASGPSLQNNIKWIEKNKHKFIIISVAGSIPRLSKHDIKPDMFVSLDSSDIVLNQLKHDKNNFLKNTPIFISSMTHKNVLNHLNKNNTYIYEIISNIKSTSIKSLTATNVGEITYAIMLSMNIQDIYILGLDAALNNDTGQSHDEINNIGKITRHNINDIKDTKLKSNIDLHDVVETKGNFKDTVKTTRLFYNSILAMNMITNLYKKEFQNIYNLSDGAFFKNTIPLKLTNINTKKFTKIDKNQFKIDLKLQLQQNSSNRLTILEKRYLNTQIPYINSLINGVKKFKKIKKIYNLKEYNQMKSEVSKALIEFSFDNKDKTYLNKVFLVFLFIVEPYIYYFFNDKNLKNKKKHIKLIHNIWCKEVIKVLNKYKKALIV